MARILTPQEAHRARKDAADDLYFALEGIAWRSDDRDNMEFAARITCFQMDRIRAALAKARGDA